jgi:hypothetical protein
MQITEFATHHTRLAGIGTALSADGRRAVREHVAPIIRILEDIVQRAIDSGIIPPQKIDTAVPMISALTAVQFAVVAKDDDLQAAIETVTEFVLHGIGAP